MIFSETPYQQSAPAPSQPTQPPMDAGNAKPASPRYNTIFSGALIAVTVLALIVAFFSSNFRQTGSQALPSTWSKVYSADLTATNADSWDQTQGCSISGSGLDASAPDTSDALCAFKPSVQTSITSAGFYFVTQLAPASNVSAFARSVISIGDISYSSGSGSATVRFIIGQDGAYVLCDGDCSQTNSSIYLHGGLASWHGDALVANTVAVKVSPDHSALTVFVNDQQVATVAPQLGPQPAIAVGAASSSEALYTRAALYTGQ